LTVPAVSGSISPPYVYTITRLLQYNPPSINCAASVQISYGGNTYCPDVISYNRTESGTTPITFTGLPSGLYKITVEKGSGTNPCATSHFVTVDPPPAYSVTASANALHPTGYHIPCYNGNTGSIIFSISGGTAPYTYIVNSSPRAGDAGDPTRVSGLTAATYTLNVTDDKGCVPDVAIADVIVTQMPEASAFKAVINDFGDPTCHNGTNGFIQLDLQNGNGPFTFLNNGSAASATGSDPRKPIFGTLSPDINYTITVTDANNCVAPAPVQSLPNPDGIVYTDIKDTDLICNGQPTGTVTVEGADGGTGGLEFSLTDAANSYGGSPVFTNLPVGPYRVWIKDARDCKTTTNYVDVDQPAAITFGTITPSSQSCVEIVDGSIRVLPATGGTGAKKFSINDIDYFDPGSEVIFSDLTSGPFTVYVQDAHGCKNTQSVFVSLSPALTGSILVQTSISCQGKNDGALNFTPGEGTSPYFYEWSNGATTEDIGDLVTGSYAVTLRDSKGCEKDFSHDLGEPPLLTANYIKDVNHGFNISCAGGNDGHVDLTPDGGTAPYTSTWSNGSTTEDLEDATAGNFSVIVTDSRACSITLTNIELTEPDPIEVTLVKHDNISCFDGSNGMIEVLAEGGTEVFDYSKDETDWYASPVFEGLAAATYTIYVLDENGCDAQLSHTLTQPSLLSVTLNKKTDTACGESNGSTTVNAGGGVPTYSFEWFNTAGSSLGTENNLKSLSSGDYEVFVTDDHGCTDSLTVVINDSNAPVVSLETIRGLTCHDSNDGGIDVEVTLGTEPYNLTWDTGAKGVYSVSALTKGEHWIEVRDASGCRNKQTYIIDAPQALVVTHSASAPLCFEGTNGSITLNTSGGNGGYSYEWESGETTSSLTALRAGTYRVNVTDIKKCASSDEIKLTDPAKFIVDAGGDRTICVGQILRISAQEPNATYRWTSTAGFTSGSRDVQLTTPATYTLMVVTALGCEDEDSFVLNTSTDLLRADFLMADEAHAGDTVIMIDISWPIPDKGVWHFPGDVTVINTLDAYAEVVFEEPGTYDVLLNTSLGECIAAFSKTITILEERQVSGGRKKGEDLITEVTVYPNPNYGQFTIQALLSESADARVRIVGSANGTSFLDHVIQNESTIKVEADLRNIPAGIYFLIIESRGQTVTRRVLVK
jgi:hypothetical protein